MSVLLGSLLFQGGAEPVAVEGLGRGRAGGGGGTASAGTKRVPRSATGVLAAFLAPAELGGAAHGEGDAAAGEVHLGDGDLDLLAGLHDFRRVFDEGVGELADVHEAILVNAHIDEGAEGGDVG